jgi:hypothetical protein
VGLRRRASGARVSTGRGGPGARGSVRWSDLGASARAFRVAHAAWGVAGLAALADIWMAALTGRRDRRLGASVAFLGLEGLALLIGRGDCPMGPFQRRLGDPVPLFELVLPSRAAKLAVPVLAATSVAGMAALLVPRRRSAASTATDGSRGATGARSDPE